VLRQVDGKWTLQPLHPFDDNESTQWAGMIGFVEVSHPSEMLPVAPSAYEDAAKFNECSFLTNDGGPLPLFKDPLYSESTTPLPPFAVIDFQ